MTKPRKAPRARQTAIPDAKRGKGGSQTAPPAARLPRGIGAVTELRPTDILPDDHNANLGTKRGEALLDESLERFGAGRSILLDKNRRNVAGNKTAQAALEKGYRVVEIEVKDPRTLIAVKRTDLDLDTPEGRGLALADNRTAEAGILMSRAEIERMAEMGAPVDAFYFPEELKAMPYLEAPGDAIAPAVRDEAPPESPETRSLAERFLVPPFSVLDARQGYWQERKRQWLSLGLQSEVGRGENLLHMSEQVLERQRRQNKGLRKGGVTGKDFAFYAKKRQWEEENGREIDTTEFREKYWKPEESYSGTSIFDPVLCELAYRWWCPPGGSILDPFAGGSVRGIVAGKLGYHYMGVDLRAEQIEANKEQGREILGTPDAVQWFEGDAREALNAKHMLPGEHGFDFVFSCPPYFDLERYSDDERDLSNARNFEAFRHDLSGIVKSAVSLLKDDRFACFVVTEIRNLKAKGAYHGLVGATIGAFEDAGMIFYNDAVLVQPVGSLPVRVRAMFEGGRKLGRTHQNVLVFYKGNVEKIREMPLPEFGDISGIVAGTPEPAVAEAKA